MSIRQRVITMGFEAIAMTKADRWLAPLARGRGVILMFHHVRPWTPRGFAPNRLLEITPDFLDTVLGQVRGLGFDIVPLSEVPDRLRGSPGSRPFAALTFDDGYRDNATFAQPILTRYAAPWTLFVTTSFADGTGRLWWRELEESIRRLDRVRVPSVGIDLSAGTDAQKAAVFEAVYWSLRAGPEEQLLAAIAGLADEAGLDGARLTREHCLDWEGLAAVARDPLVTIGAHTLTHPMLAKHDDATALREIRESRRIIESRLGRTVDHFAYPVGDVTSAGPRDFALAREAGFATAVTTRPGHVFAGHAHHLHALPRVSVNGNFQDAAAVRALLSGVPFLAWNRGHRLDVD